MKGDDDKMDTPTDDEILTLRKKWARALRSGDYEQARLIFKIEFEDYTAHCCLAVLADVADPYGRDGRTHVLERVGDHTITDSLRRMVGISRDDVRGFVACNDKGFADFDQIAAIVEHLPITRGL